MAGIQETINKGIGIVAGAVAIPKKLDEQAQKIELAKKAEEEKAKKQEEKEKKEEAKATAIKEKEESREKEKAEKKEEKAKKEEAKAQEKAKKEENRNIQLMEIANKRAQDLKIAKARQKKLLKEHFYGYLEGSNKDTGIANKITIAEMSLGGKKEHSPENILKEIYKNERKIGGDLYGK